MLKKLPQIIFYNASYSRAAAYSIRELKLTSTLFFKAKLGIVGRFPATYFGVCLVITKEL
jgi:hypothetical protein